VEDRLSGEGSASVAYFPHESGGVNLVAQPLRLIVANVPAKLSYTILSGISR
jgi:hypothetical protein